MRRAARVAALYDVHGNLPALEAVLAELDKIEVETVVVGGDFVPGPFPRETTERLLALGARSLFIRGNGERELFERRDDDADADWAARQRFVARQLSGAQLEFARRLPPTTAVEIEGLGTVLFCHGSPRRDDEIVTAVTPEERLTDMLDGTGARVVVCGHTHHQFDRAVGATRVVNPGSLGMPYEDAPGAYWALLGPDIELRRTAYDLERAAERIRASAFPAAEEFAREFVLSTGAGAAEAAKFFEGMAAG